MGGEDGLREDKAGSQEDSPNERDDEGRGNRKRGEGTDL